MTHWTTKCELLVDAKHVDSGAIPLLGGTLKLADTINGTMGNVISGNGLRPRWSYSPTEERQRLQFAHQLVVSAQHQIRFDPGLDRHKGKLGEMRSFGISETGVRELGERLPPSQP